MFAKNDYENQFTFVEVMSEDNEGPFDTVYISMSDFGV